VAVAAAAAAVDGADEAERRRCRCCHLPTMSSSCSATWLCSAAMSFLQRGAAVAVEVDDDICARASNVSAVFLQQTIFNHTLITFDGRDGNAKVRRRLQLRFDFNSTHLIMPRP